VACSGFDKLVAWLCAGEVGAVLWFDASRLAATAAIGIILLELCGLVGARVIDLDGVYRAASSIRVRRMPSSNSLILPFMPKSSRSFGRHGL